MLNKKYLMLILTTTAGNILEWYDFALYGYFASIFAKLFFPSENEFISLMITFGVFASGFVVRPLGGALFGHIGDKYGRKKALIASIILITLPTVMIGLLPPYQKVGIIAPIMLTLLRLMQGLAVSGELTGAGAFLVESAPPHKRGLWGSLIMCSTYTGLVIGSLVGAIVSMIFTSQQMITFGWRIPFLLSLFFGVIALFLRLKCEESPLFLQLISQNKLVKFPITKIFTDYLKETVNICFLSSGLAVAIYLMIGYFPTFFASTLGVPLKETMLINFCGLLVLALLVPIMGNLADTINKKRIFGYGTLAFIFSSLVIFKIAGGGQVLYAILAEILVALFLAPIAGTLITILAEMFPTNVRYTGISIGYNLSMTIFGGTTPLLAIYLTKLFNNMLAPAYYLIFCNVLAFFVLMKLKSNSQDLV